MIWALAVMAMAITTILALPSLATLLGWGPPALPSPGRRVEISDELGINAYDRGEGRSIVLVHGSWGNAHGWGRLGDELVGSGYRVVRYDRIGFGRADRRAEDNAYTIAANARELLGLIRVLDLERPILVGWSYGGWVVQRAALDAPREVGPLVLIGTSAGPSPRVSSRGIVARLAMSEPVLRWVAGSRLTAVPVLERVFTKSFSGPPPEGFAARGHATVAAKGVMHSWLMEGRYSRWDEVDPALLQGGVLILHGTADRIIPFEAATELHAAISSSKLSPLDGGSHMLPVTHPEWIVERIREARW